MKVSTRGRYALRMMLDIATNDHGEPVRIKDIAARQDISVKYLEQIVSVLTKAIFPLCHVPIAIMTVRKCRIVLQFVYGRN